LRELASLLDVNDVSGDMYRLECQTKERQRSEIYKLNIPMIKKILHNLFIFRRIKVYEY